LAPARDQFEGTHPEISHVDCLNYGAEVSDFDLFGHIRAIYAEE